MPSLTEHSGIAAPDPVDDTVAARLLRDGEVEIVGRMPWSSNATFLTRVGDDAGNAVLAIYKPERGERSLWDFPDGTLWRREVAARVLADALGWSIVPDTIARDDAPVGIGSLQRFHDHDPEAHYFELLGDHAEELRRFAVFDILANNTDRKGGHVLRDDEGRIWGIDHGVCFHVHWKLRTVIWDFAGDRIDDPLLADVECVRDRIVAEQLPALAELLAPAELDAIASRAARVLETRRYPVPSGDYHDYPWPTI